MTESQPLKFEQAIERVEQIVEQIEMGEIGLEEAIQQTEEGMKLIGHCRQILDRAEKRIAELTEDASGELVAEEEDLEADLEEDEDLDED